MRVGDFRRRNGLRTARFFLPVLLIILLSLVVLGDVNRVAVQPASGSSSASQTGSSQSSSPPSSSTGSSPQCVPIPYRYGTISKTIFDLVLSTEGNKTSILGISRVPIAVGIKKEIRELKDGVVCKPLPAQRKMSQEFLKRVYGDKQMNIEPQLVDITFLSGFGKAGSEKAKNMESVKKFAFGKTDSIKVHRKVAPAFQCVEKEIMASCPGWNDYKISSLQGYLWSPLPDNPDILSASSFGIALDISLDDGSNVPSCWVQAFKKFGFAWGGDNREVPAYNHFEFLGDPNAILVGSKQQVSSASVAAPVSSPYSIKADDGNIMCSYCGDMKSMFKRLYPDDNLMDCVGWLDCCRGKCPPGSYINPKAKYFSQADKSNYPMPAECVSQPAPPKKQYTYGNIGCAAFSWRMALSAYGIDRSAKDVFCGKLSNIAVFPAFGESIKRAYKNAGVNLKIVPFDWNTIVSEVKQGHPLIWDLDDKGLASTDRCPKSRTSQHFMVAVGASDDYLIIDDPGGWCGHKFSEHMVLSKDYFLNSAKHKIMYVIYPPGEHSADTI